MRVKKPLLFIILFVAYIYTHAQVAEPTILFMEPRHGEGNDQVSKRGTVLNNGGIVGIFTASQTGEFGNHCVGSKYKLVLNKYKPDGYTLEWIKCYGNEGNTDSSFGFLFPLANNCFMVGGSTGINVPPTGGDVIIRKEDASGNILWGSKRYGGSVGEDLRDMIATEDGGYLMIARTNSNDGDVGAHYGGQFTHDIWVLKVDSNGNKVWGTVLGGSGDEEPTCVVPIPDGGCYVLGYTMSNDFDCITNHGNDDVFLARLDSNGNKLWIKCLGGSGFDGSRLNSTSVWGTPDDKGGVLIVASTNSTDGDVTSLIGKGDFWLLNIDSTGTILWDKCYGGPDSDEFPQTICKGTDGSIWMGGVSTKKGGQVANHYGKDDGWLVHTDSVGYFLSAKVFGGPDKDEIIMLHPLPDGLVMVGGNYHAAGGTVPDTFAGGIIDVFLARVAPWTTAINDNTSNDINDKLIAFPNPASTELQIASNNKGQMILITDLTGRQVYSGYSEAATKLNVSNWVNGIYFVQVVDADGNQYNQKILKQ